jgi:shikimate kinase
MDQSIILIGFMGVGKTSVGNKLASQLNWPLIDCDTVITQAHGNIADLISNQSESVFRDIEYAVLDQALGQSPAIISTGGGIVTHPKSIDRLLNSLATVIWLKASFSVISHRLSTQEKAQRPLFDDQVLHRFEQRQPLYQSCASHCIDTGMLTTEAVAEIIVTRYVNN